MSSRILHQHGGMKKRNLLHDSIFRASGIRVPGLRGLNDGNSGKSKRRET